MAVLAGGGATRPLQVRLVTLAGATSPPRAGPEPAVVAGRIERAVAKTGRVEGGADEDQRRALDPLGADARGDGGEGRLQHALVRPRGARTTTAAGQSRAVGRQQLRHDPVDGVDREMDRQRRAASPRRRRAFPSAASPRRGRRCGSARRTAPPPAASARGRAPRRRRRRPGRPASACRGCRSASSRRSCSPTALQIERSPDCRRATSSPALVGLANSATIASRSRGAVSTMRAPGGHQASISARHERAGIEADRAGLDKRAAAHRDEVRRRPVRRR